MKNIVVSMLFLCALRANAQEKLNKFYVIDSLSGKAVPSVSVTLVRSKLSINTEKDGIFIIAGNLSAMRDTVILYAQNYRTDKMPIRQLNGRDTIRLTKFVADFKSASTKYNDDTLLNNYRKRDIVHYAGVNTNTTKFEYLQLAQQFYTPKPGTVLKSIKLNRLSFGLDESDYTWTHLVHLDVTKFRIRIYDIDPITHGPGRDLCTKVIEESKSVGSQASINLKKYNITIPNATFFVAVEWMRDFYNAGYSISKDEKGNVNREINYRPAIGISAVTGNRLNIWALNIKREWEPFTYFMPFGTDLAMSATIAY